ncbi:hypothetical protein AB1N83_012947 [Pleurotus pulmonarius]
MFYCAASTGKRRGKSLDIQPLLAPSQSASISVSVDVIGHPNTNIWNLDVNYHARPDIYSQITGSRILACPLLGFPEYPPTYNSLSFARLVGYHSYLASFGRRGDTQVPRSWGNRTPAGLPEIECARWKRVAAFGKREIRRAIHVDFLVLIRIRRPFSYAPHRSATMRIADCDAVPSFSVPYASMHHTRVARRIASEMKGFEHSAIRRI